MAASTHIQPPGKRGYAISLVATLLFVVGSIFVIGQLFVMHRALSQRDGENMVWALAQAQIHATQLERDLARMKGGGITADALELQADILHSRLALLNDGPQQRTLAHYGQAQEVQAAIAAFAQMDGVQLLLAADDTQARQALTDLTATLSQAGNQVMVRERNEKSQHLESLATWINAALVAISMVVLCGGVLLWQLRQAARRQRADMRTIAEQRDALQQTVHDLHQAQNATETYRNFVSLVSHQFRTPLAVIDSSAQRLMRNARKPGGADADLLVERMGHTRNTIEGLTRLLDSVLTSVKLENGGIQLQAQPLNLVALANYAIDSCKSLLGTRQVQISVQGDAQDYDTAGDTELLAHVLHNLIANACKYTPADSPVTLVLSRDDTRLCCTVRDQGAGVSADELPRLFERFYRASPSNHATQGSGLGLYLARSVAQLHQGDLNASLPDGGGLAFHLQLPAAKPVAQRPAAVLPGSANMANTIV